MAKLTLLTCSDFIYPMINMLEKSKLQPMNQIHWVLDIVDLGKDMEML